MFPNDPDVSRVAKAFYDPFEYLMLRHAAGQLNTAFSESLGDVLYQASCHQRVQNIGPKTRDVLSLIPDTVVTVMERCSGHDGTYGVRKETHTYAVKIGKPVAKKITDNTDLVVSDCVMAGSHIAHIATQNIEAIHPITLVKIAYCL